MNETAESRKKMDEALLNIESLMVEKKNPQYVCKVQKGFWCSLCRQIGSVGPPFVRLLFLAIFNYQLRLSNGQEGL